MLDYFAIFTKGGALLWTLQFTAALKHSPTDALNALVRGCLLEERASDSAYTYQPKAGAAQSLKWTFHNVSARCCSETPPRRAMRRAAAFARSRNASAVVPVSLFANPPCAPRPRRAWAWYLSRRTSGRCRCCTWMSCWPRCGTRLRATTTSEGLRRGDGLKGAEVIATGLEQTRQPAGGQQWASQQWAEASNGLEPALA